MAGAVVCELGSGYAAVDQDVRGPDGHVQVAQRDVGLDVHGIKFLIAVEEVLRRESFSEGGLLHWREGALSPAGDQEDAEAHDQEHGHDNSYRSGSGGWKAHVRSFVGMDINLINEARWSAVLGRRHKVISR